MTAPASLQASAVWEKTLWQGEPAWVSSRGCVEAVVSAARARLIRLGPAEDTLNLLNAPNPRAEPTALDPAPNQGGHRFWLGPQQRWGWPPPKEWEYSPAHDITAENGALTVRHPRLNPAYPAITREYSWEGSRLRCTAHWLDGGTPFFGLHIVAVDLPLSVGVRLAPGTDAPAGFVAARMLEPPAPVALPHPALSVTGPYATVSSGVVTAKLGFAMQPLVIERARRWRLALHPGPHTGIVIEYPDNGYTSQVWVGDATHDLAELEQVSPWLKGDAAGRCSSTVWLEALPPPP